MAHVKLQANADVDLASGDELREQTADLTRAIKAGPDDPTITIERAQLVVDAGGLVGGGLTGPGVVVYDPPTGMAASIHRLHVYGAGAITPAAPLAAGWLTFYRGTPSPGNVVAFFPTPGSTQVLPNGDDWGRDTAPLVRSGEPLVVAGAALTAGIAIGVTLQVRLLPTLHDTNAP